MNKFIVACVIALLSACGSTPNRLVYSSGFSFANYDYVIISKPDGPSTNTTLYGMDVEFANLLSKYNMNVIGENEFSSLTPDNQKRTLKVRLSVSASGDNIVLSASFDDAVTGRTGSSVTGAAEGDIFDGDDRGKALESVSATIVKALEKDKGLKIVDEKKSRH